MNKAQEEFTKAVYETIKDKVFFSNFSSRPADVVEKLPEEMVPGKVLFDGMMLLDGIEGIEDDIQQMHSYLKDGTIVNLEDYYTDNGAFEDEGCEKFIGALEQLMTLDEFFKYLEDRGEDPDWLYLTHDSFPANEPLYPIDENGHLEIPAGTRKILPDTLMNCENLSSVVIPEGVTIIGVCSFIGCENLRYVQLPEGLRTIDAYAFSGCTALESIIIPQSVRIIAHGAFKGCTGLTRVVIPGSISIVGEGAFEECTCLTDDDMSLIKAKESPYDSVEISITACVVGTKEAIIRVLNQAFRLFGSDKIVLDAGSSLEEMNWKIHEALDRMDGDPDLDEQPDGYGAEFTLLDFLDDNNKMRSPYEDYVLSYIDEEYPDGSEEYRIGLLDVIEDGGEYVAKIMSVVNECQDTYLDEDWWIGANGWSAFTAAR